MPVRDQRDATTGDAKQVHVEGGSSPRERTKRPLRFTFLLSPQPAEAIGHFQTHYSHANELARRGHDVTIVNAIPPGLRPRVEAALARDPDIALPAARWFRFDPAVRVLHHCFHDANDTPEGDVLFGQVFAESDRVYPPDRGANFLICNGYAEMCSEEAQHQLWRTAGWKIMNASWIRDRALEVGIPPFELGHVANGVDTSTFFPARPIEERVEQIALHLSVGLKGGVIGVQALSMLRARWPHASAVVFGRMERPDWLPAWARYVRSPSRKELVEEIYGTSSVFLCPGIREGFNNPSLEAMACGCAVVGTDMGAMQDYARHGENALLAPIRAPGQLAAHMETLFRDQELRVRLARQGTATASRMSWAAAAARLEKHVLPRVEVSRRLGTDPRRAFMQGTPTRALESALREVLDGQRSRD